MGLVAAMCSSVNAVSCVGILNVKLSIFSVGVGLHRDGPHFGPVREADFGASGLSPCQDAGTPRPGSVSLGTSSVFGSCLRVIGNGARDGRAVMVTPVGRYWGLHQSVIVQW